MVTANCTRCGATAEGNSFEDARVRLNHAIGRTRGIKCGDNCNCVVEVKKEKSVEKKVEPKVETPTPTEKVETFADKPKKSKHKESYR